MLVCPRSCATVSMSPVVASTLLANVRRPEWPEPPNSARGSIHLGWPLAAWRQSRPHWLEG